MLQIEEFHISNKAENIVGETENADYKHFLLFHKKLSQSVVQTLIHLVKELNAKISKNSFIQTYLSPKAISKLSILMS